MADTDMSGRTVAVTGSASGIGAATARRLADHGARVITLDVVAGDIVADLAEADGRRAAVGQITDLAGGRLDGLVLCAGLSPLTDPVASIVSVNYFGMVELLDGLLPVLGAGDRPAAAIVSSNSSTLVPADDELRTALLAADEVGARKRATEMGNGAIVYGVSKLVVAQAARHRVPPFGAAGVRLNVVVPGPTETPMLDGLLADAELGPLVEGLPSPLGRNTTADGIAAALEFLIDPGNPTIHGSVLFVDGGTDAVVRPDQF